MRIADIKLGYSCNNNCVFCAVKTDAAFLKKEGKAIDRSFNQYINELRKSRKSFDRVVITGGEPTIRKDIFRILDYAKSLNYNIEIQTNGRMLSYLKFARKFIKHNATYLVSIHGHNKKIHELLTRVLDSFEQTTEGIKNLLYLKQNVGTNTIITKQNYKYLKDIAKYISNLGVKRMNFAFPDITGNCFKNFDNIVPEYSQIAPYLLDLLNYCKSRKVNCSTEDIPFCFLKGYAEYCESYSRASLKEVNTLRGTVYNPPLHTRKTEKCRGCRYYNKCEGIHYLYIQKKGDDELNPIMQLKANDLIAQASKLYVSKRKNNFLVIEPETASWAIVGKNLMNLLDRIKNPIVVKTLLKDRDRKEKTKKAILKFYNLGIIKINKKQVVTPKILKKYQNSYPTLCNIYLTNICNLRCKYCYTDSSGKGPKMSLETMKKIIDKILELPNQRFTFEFNGGEALLLFDTIEKAVRYGYKRAQQMKKGIKFAMQSNGTLITQKIAQSLRNNSIGIGISLDGPREIHDENRIYPNGKGSFDDVMKGVEILKRSEIKVGAITVVSDPKNLRKIYDFMRINKIHGVQFNPYYVQGRAKEDKMNDRAQQKFANEHLKLLDLTLRRGDKMRMAMITHMLGNIISRERNFMCMRSPCGAGTSYISIDPKGNIYPCQKMYSKEFYIGNIHDNKSIKQILDSLLLVRTLKRRTVNNIPECKKCPLKWFCGSSCTLMSYYAYNSFFRKSKMCSYYKKMYTSLFWRLFEQKKEPSNYLKPYFLAFKHHDLIKED